MDIQTKPERQKKLKEELIRLIQNDGFEIEGFQVDTPVLTHYIDDLPHTKQTGEIHIYISGQIFNDNKKDRSFADLARLI